MKRPVIPENIQALSVKETEIPEAPARKQDIAALKGEAKRVVKRIAGIGNDMSEVNIDADLVRNGDATRGLAQGGRQARPRGTRAGCGTLA